MNKQQLKGMEVNVENVDLMVNVAKVPKDLQIIQRIKEEREREWLHRQQYEIEKE